MTKGFELYRQQICDLYEHLTLKEVRGEMKHRYGFDAGVRAYRNHLKKWKVLKKDRPDKFSVQDSATRSTGSATSDLLQQSRGLAPSPTSTLSSDTQSSWTSGSSQTSATSVSTSCCDYPIDAAEEDILYLISQQSAPSPSVPLNAPYATSAAAVIAAQSQSSPISTSWLDTGLARSSDLSVPTPCSDNSINTLAQSPVNLTSQLPAAPLLDPLNALCATSTAAEIPAQRLLSQVTVLNVSPELQPSISPGSPQVPDLTNLSVSTTGTAGTPRQVKTVTSPPLNWAPCSPPHAPPSRCRFARKDPSIPTVNPRQCHFCKATELHYLATISPILDKETLVEQINVASQDAQMNQCDVFGNNPGHFLAASGPTVSTILMFHQAGIDLFRRNRAGESFLHLLNPVRLQLDLPSLLEWFREQNPDFLTQRTHHGKTVLHRLLEQPCFLHQLHWLKVLLDIIPMFQSAKTHINSRDNKGFTPMELFRDKWLAVKEVDGRSHEERDTFYQVLKLFTPGLTLHSDGAQVSPAALINGRVPYELSPNSRYSGDLTWENLQLRDSELRDIIAMSVYNPLVQDCRARNGLHCLVLLTRLSPDIDQHLAMETLVNLLDRGVDVNAFDFLGSTPLHTLLSYPRAHIEDTTIALFAQRMILDYGADPHLRDRNGNTALHLACKSGRLSCVEILLDLGANANARNYDGWSAVAEAQHEMATSFPNDAARIQQCINHVRNVIVNDPLQDDDLPYYQDINSTESSLIETGCFLPP